VERGICDMDQFRVVVGYRVDHRLSMVQVVSGDVKFLVSLRMFSSVNPLLDHWEHPEGKVAMSLSNYQTLHRERMQ